MSTMATKKRGEYLYVPTRELFSWWYKPDRAFTVVGTGPKDAKNVLIVSNHQRFIDAWLISSLLSHQRISWCTKIQIHEPNFYHALASDIENKLARVIGSQGAKLAISVATSLAIHVMNHCDTIIMDPENIKNPLNRSVVKNAQTKFLAGKWIGIFPEGGINTPKGEAKFGGMLMLARKFNLDMYQVYLDYEQSKITFYEPIPSREVPAQLSLIESRLYGEVP